ncbi:MAG: hypothetical protein IJS67_03290, partial [Clostridia bacterium]|nr:hypothetical protein [Clostridia bacterium]
TIEVKYKDLTTKVRIKVYDPDLDGNYVVTSFGSPENLMSRSSGIDNAGKSQYGDDNFRGEFFADEDYTLTVGDDNAFVFVPHLILRDEDDEVTEPERYKTDTTLYIVEETENRELSAREGEENDTVVYYDGNVKIATAFVNLNEYDFEEAAIGKKFVISVMPSQSYEFNAKNVTKQEITVEIKDGYNVYSAVELSVIDNTNGDWAELKYQNGLLGIDPAAIMIQGDIAISSEDLPADMRYTITGKTLNYYNYGDYDNALTQAQLDEKGVYVTDERLLDWEMIYEREMQAGQSFDIYGNYFTLDAKRVPFVSSYEWDTAHHHYYGSDFSNTTLIRFKGQENATEYPEYSINNWNCLGNAKRTEVVDDTEKHNSICAGGLLFARTQNANIVMDNVVMQTFFISLLAEDGGNMSGTRLKSYETYQDVGFFTFGITAEFENCYFEDAGAPIFIMQHYYPEASDTVADSKRIPVVSTKNCVLNTKLTGKEKWFESVGAETKFADILALDQIIRYNFGKTYSYDGKLNIVCLLMENGSGTDALLNTDVQGLFTVNYTKGEEQKVAYIDRLFNDSAFAGAYKPYLNYYGNYLPVFYSDRTGCGVYMGQPDLTFAPDAEAVKQSVSSSDYITLCQGGMGLMLSIENIAG